MTVLKMLSVFAFTALMATGCSEKGLTVGEVDQSKQETQTQQQPVTQAAGEPRQEATEIAGVVTETEKGVSIVTDTETYLVSGQDLSGMMGKRIKVTGTLTEVEEVQILEVMTVLPLE